MIRRSLPLALAALLLASLGATPARAASGPYYDVHASWGDTNLPPGGRGLLEAGSLLRFSPPGSPEPFSATPAHPAGVAVDPANGNLYAIDVAPAGGATLRTYTPEGTEAAVPCALEWAPGTPLPEPAVDSGGDLYYPNTATGTVQKLEPGCIEAPLAHPIAGLNDPNSVALDAAGNVYVVDGTTSGSDIASGRLQKFASDGTPLEAFAGLDGTSAAKGEVTSVAVDRSTGKVFVGRGWGSSFYIQRYSSAGVLVKPSIDNNIGKGKFASQGASLYSYNQLALNEANKTIYAANPDPASLGDRTVFAKHPPLGRESLGGVRVFEFKGEILGYQPAMPLATGKLTSAVAVDQASKDVYAASAGALNDLAQFELQARNIGDAVEAKELTITDQLPAGVTIASVHWDNGEVEPSGEPVEDFSKYCTGRGTETLSCKLPKEASGGLKGVGELVKVFPNPNSYLPPIFFTLSVPPGASGAATNLATVSGGGSPEAFSDEDQLPFDPAPSPFGVRAPSFLAEDFSAIYPFGAPVRQAGAHPYEFRVDFELNQRTGIGKDGTRFRNTNGLVRTVETTLPRGMIGNPEATPKCSPLDFAKLVGTGEKESCPADTQIGYISVFVGSDIAAYGRSGTTPNPNNLVIKAPVYNLEPPKGTPSDLAFFAGPVEAHIYSALDPAQNYAIKTVAPNIAAPLLFKTRFAELTVWGVPGDPAHDRYRRLQDEAKYGAPWGSAPIRPFLTNPMDCGEENGGSRLRVESYEEPGAFSPVTEYGDPLNVEGCDDLRFRFEPEVKLQPSDLHAGAPTGLDVHLKVPQRSDEVTNAERLYAEEADGTVRKDGPVQAIPTPPIKKAVVTFPEGMTLSPSAAQGLGSCTPAQIGLGTDKPVTCPDNSQYGKLTLHTPILPASAQPEGFIYIAHQNENPFGSFLALYLVIEEPQRGVLVKIPGRLDLDHETGQITATFDELPQFPVSDMQMSFKSGVRAGLVEPSTCGEKTIEATFYTWQDPTRPVPSNSSYEITQKPDGSPCLNSLAERPFRPSLEAGTLNPRAGAYSPFVMRLTRSDEDQELSQLGVKLPMGLAAKFAGVGICPEAGVAQALSRETVAGDGALEQADSSCPASSQIGTTEVGAGVGVPLSWVPGRVYLAGPYKGAPMSLVVISPAIVGPYDLGVITVRTALEVNPETAQGEALSDPFPQIFQGIPVRIRDIRLRLDRPGFTLNPTSCAEKQIEAHITGTGGDLASTADDTASSLRSRFQAADCASLGFRLSLALLLKGGTKRGAHPKLKAVVRMPEGGANIARAQVTLPHSEFLDQGHLNNICTRVQFAAHECPAASVYGYARAKTPLFDSPLEGPVYLRSSSHRLPDLVAALKGPASQPVEVDLDGRIDSVGGGIRNSFEVVPDAPVEEFTLEMQGGRKGLLVNSTDLCAKTYRAIARFSAQNGRRLTLRPALRSGCARKRHGPHR